MKKYLLIAFLVLFSVSLSGVASATIINYNVSGGLRFLDPTLQEDILLPISGYALINNNPFEVVYENPDLVWYRSYEIVQYNIMVGNHSFIICHDTEDFVRFTLNDTWIFIGGGEFDVTSGVTSLPNFFLGFTSENRAFPRDWINALAGDIDGYNYLSESSNIKFSYNSTAPVPEPSTMLLLGSGLLGLIGFRKKIRK
jgi:hypothetical protein